MLLKQFSAMTSSLGIKPKIMLLPPAGFILGGFSKHVENVYAL